MAIETLKDDTEIVFISGLNLHKTPEIVQEAMASKEAQGPIPIAAVFDARVENLLGVVPYFHMKDVDGFTEVTSALAAMRGKPSPLDSMKRHAPETWTNNRGRSIEAAYVTSSKDDVTVRLANGKTATIPLTSLSETSRARVEELTGGG